MWNKREEDTVRPPAVRESAAPTAATAERRGTAGIGPSITIVGDVTGDEDLTILGKVEGKIDLPQHSVTIGEGGRVKADIRAKVVSVAGEVHGNLVAGEQIVIRRTATMLGNLTAPRVGLEDGCCFRGSVEMETPPAKGRTAAGGPHVGTGTAPASSGSGIAPASSATGTASASSATGTASASSGTGTAPASTGSAAPKPEPLPRP